MHYSRPTRKGEEKENPETKPRDAIRIRNKNHIRLTEKAKTRKEEINYRKEQVPGQEQKGECRNRGNRAYGHAYKDRMKGRDS